MWLWISSSNIFLSLQVGSYFGGELCGVDVDRDGETELLLIAAPLYYGEQRGGRVFIYQKIQVGTRTLSTERERDSQAFSGLSYSESFLSDPVLIRPLEQWQTIASMQGWLKLCQAQCQTFYM